jgi:DNA-binding transcriptional ArsR family regulator
MAVEGDDAEDTSILSVLDDEYARAILIETSIEPLSASDLSERCDASPPTIYRRIEQLQDHDLIVEQQQLDPDGHHYKTYQTRMERVTVEIEDGDCTIDVARREVDAADRFTRLFEGLSES